MSIDDWLAQAAADRDADIDALEWMSEQEITYLARAADLHDPDTYAVANPRCI